jgi:hypothetical protein
MEKLNDIYANCNLCNVIIEQKKSGFCSGCCKFLCMMCYHEMLSTYGDYHAHFQDLQSCYRCTEAFAIWLDQNSIHTRTNIELYKFNETGYLTEDFKNIGYRGLDYMKHNKIHYNHAWRCKKCDPVIKQEKEDNCICHKCFYCKNKK